jgi:peroxiredoxin Q/BCP
MASSKSTAKTRLVRGVRSPGSRLARGSARAARLAQPEAAQPTRAITKQTTALARRPKNDTLAKRGSGEIDVGRRAPSFRLLDQDAQLFDSYALEGKPYVLYFYPKDDTPGCTQEACDFRDSLSRFARRKVEVIGVSPDAPGSHARFCEKYGLPFRLLSDPKQELAKKYGVWVKKQNYGREYMGILRSTFLVDKKGIVRKAWRGIRVPGHVENVLSEASQL